MNKAICWPARALGMRAVRASALGVVMGALMCLGTAHAQPASPTETATAPVVTTAKKAAVKAKKGRSKSKSASRSRAKFMRGSEETPAQRSARLQRECLGAVNAGACTGYTR